MSVSLKQYTMRYLVVAILAIMTIWASLFYAFILDEVYDNVDDGLRDQKISILRAVYEDSNLLNTASYGVNQFRISKIAEPQFSERNVFSNEMYYMPYDDEDEPYRVLRTGFYGPDEQTYQLEIRTSTVEEDDLIFDLSIALGVLYVFMVGSIFLLNHYVLTRAWRPFWSILQGLDEYHVGKSSKLDPLPTKIREFRLLHDRVDEMIQRNERVFAEQKLFIENASHELQTPLAITINKIDFLMEREDIGEDVIVSLVETKNALQRMINLNRSLLVLSKIENGQFLQDEVVDLQQITQELLQQSEDIVTHRSLHVQFSVSAPCFIQGNYDLLHMMLSNLLRNAIRYTDRGGEIKIVLKNGQWQIQNSSSQGALPASYIFKRFYKGVDSAQSTGLGLSIVQAIVGMTRGASINYSFENNFHFFSISFPDS